MRLAKSVSRPWRVALVLLTLIAIVAVVGIIAARTLLAAQDRLSATRDQLQLAVEAATSGDPDDAAAAFRDAADEAESAVALVRSPEVRLVGFLPIVGSTVDSIVATTEASDLVADAGSQIMGAVAELPGGLDAITLGGGGEVGWLDAVERLTQPVTEASAHLQLAHDLVDRAPTETLVPRVDQARARLLDELGDILPVMRNGAELAAVLPSLFGDETPRRYFLAAHNPAELRGTGGFIGAYAVMTASDGQIDIGSFGPIQELEKDIFTLEVAASAEFYDRYQHQIADRGTWLNVNMSPDFPAVAETIMAMYRESEGERLDGVIFVDPFALQAMLRATGAITSPDPDVGVLSADSVVDYVTNEAPIALGPGGERKEVLGDAAKAVLEAFLSGDVPGGARIRAFAEAIAGGHLLVHHADPQVQAVLEAVGAGGALPTPEGTVLALSVANAAESKADYWLDRAVDWEVTLDPDGTASATVTVTLTNSTPVDPSLPAYITGSTQNVPAFWSRSIVSVFCGTCVPRLISYPDDGELGQLTHTEAGHTALTAFPQFGPGETVEVRYVVDLPRAWGRSGGGGVFAPTFWSAPSINGTDVTMTVTPPTGWRFQPPEGQEHVELRDGLAVMTATDVRELSASLTLTVRTDQGTT